MKDGAKDYKQYDKHKAEEVKTKVKDSFTSSHQNDNIGMKSVRYEDSIKGNEKYRDKEGHPDSIDEKRKINLKLEK